MAGVAGGGSVARGKDAGKRDAEIERAVGLHVVVRRAAAAVLHGAAGERDLRVGLRVEVGADGGVQRILRAARLARGRGAGDRVRVRRDLSRGTRRRPAIAGHADASAEGEPWWRAEGAG